MIALLAITLASMPIKSLNKEWDEMDPNMTIPANVHDILPQNKAVDLEPQSDFDHQTRHRTVDRHEDEAAIGMAGSSLENRGPKKSGEAVHVESV